MICRECNYEMRRDHVESIFHGCKDIYWVCDFCITSCYEKIRYDKPFSEIWHTENDGIIKDYEVRKKINFQRGIRDDY